MRNDLSDNRESYCYANSRLLIYLYTAPIVQTFAKRTQICV
jgi:hypothetical protein